MNFVELQKVKAYKMIELFNRCLNASYIHTDEDGDYAIEVEGSILYILFQWSNSKLDWLHNFNFPAKPYKRMNKIWFCHRGFLKVWKALQDSVEADVVRMLLAHPEVTAIKCVGYSHGAAIALLATEDMSFLYGSQYSVTGCGFGCPRVLWGFVPKEVMLRIKNFIPVRNIPDIVTHVPPACFGFHHPSTLTEVGELGTYNCIDAHRPEAYRKELPS